MAWAKGRKRVRKTGGRKKGSKNRASARREAEIASSGLTPLDYMLKVLRDGRRKLSERMWAAAAAAPYVHPKLANVQLQGDPQKPVAVEILKPAADRVAWYHKRLEAIAADRAAPASESRDYGDYGKISRTTH